MRTVEADRALAWVTDFFFVGIFVSAGAALSLCVGIECGNPEGWLLDVGQGAVIGGLAAWMIQGGIFKHRTNWWPTERAKRRVAQDRKQRR